MSFSAIRKIFILSCLFFCSYVNAQNLDSLLLVLDKTIEQQEIYDGQKEKRISELKNQLIATSQLADDLYRIQKALYQEYEAYICDSALHYSDLMLSLSEGNKNVFWINEAKLQQSRMFAGSGRYYESIEVLQTIKKETLTMQQLETYYINYADTYVYWAEYNNQENSSEYSEIKRAYQDSALAILPSDSYGYVALKGRMYIESGQFDEAKSILDSYASQIRKDTHEYAIYTSVLAYLYERTNDIELQKKYLALSAITDAKQSVKENLSLRHLAVLLLDSGDIERANRYIKKSVEDANFYNARLRNIQISKILPIIDEAYQKDKEEQQRKLKMLLAAVSILSLALLFAIIYVVRQMQKLKKTRRELSSVNKSLSDLNTSLSESNHIKEEYIGRFLSLCSTYIDKLENYRRSLNKKASAGKYDELVSMLKSSEIVENELKDFYQNFDTAFLNIFPDFVVQFNELLTPEDRIILKQTDSLNTELRVFALIRLGITDSTKIANFLRYSVTTIYNYRSKYRNKSVAGRDLFEDLVMKIGNYRS